MLLGMDGRASAVLINMVKQYILEPFKLPSGNEGRRKDDTPFHKLRARAAVVREEDTYNESQTNIYGV